MDSNSYLVILCGGTGPRLWPLSRASYPKQFLTISNHQSLLQQTVARCLQLVTPSHLYLVTNKKYLPLIKNQLKTTIPSRNILLEPSKKNTAMAIVYAASVIQKSDPSAVIATIPSDQYIHPASAFRHDLSLALTHALHQPKIVLLGIKPLSPSPSFGYIVFRPHSSGLHPITKFVEKPISSVASRLIGSRNCFWNSGIYVFQPKTLLAETQIHASKYARAFLRLEKNPDSLNTVYRLSPNLAIDKAVSEKSKNLVVLPATFTWSDIGEWKSIYRLLASPQQPLVSLGSSPVVQLNSQRNLVHAPSKKLVGLVGIDNLAIIDTPDALLVCNIAHDGSFQVRDLVSQIVKNKKYKKYFLTFPHGQ